VNAETSAGDIDLTRQHKRITTGRIAGDNANAEKNTSKNGITIPIHRPINEHTSQYIAGGSVIAEK
jgi:hypothetical protein